MDEALNRKYKRVLEILPDVSMCAGGKLVLVGGTALALFYLNHRISVDLDFVPDTGNDVKLKEELKGCLTKRGYRTTVGAFKNQFVIQFEDSSIKVEVFIPKTRIKKIEERTYGSTKIKIASLQDILEMKISTYRNRKEARDLFDIFCMRKFTKNWLKIIEELVSKEGIPKNMDEIDSMARSDREVTSFKKVVFDALA